MRGWLLRTGSAQLVPIRPGLAAGRKKIKLSGLALDHKVTGDRFYTHVTIVGQRLSQKAPSLEEGADVFISSQDVRGASENPPESECLVKRPVLGDNEGGSSCLVNTHPKRSFSLLVVSPHPWRRWNMLPIYRWGQSELREFWKFRLRGTGFLGEGGREKLPEGGRLSRPVGQLVSSGLPSTL